jgi:hypothetical protein
MQSNRHSVGSATLAGVLISALLGLANVAVSSAPAGSVVYCQ